MNRVVVRQVKPHGHGMGIPAATVGDNDQRLATVDVTANLLGLKFNC